MSSPSSTSSLNTIDDSAYTVFKQDGSHQFYCRWTVEEDKMLAKAVADHGPHKWTLVSRYVPGRTAVQCSTRWFGALNPNVHKGRWSSHEDQALTKAVKYFETMTKSGNLPWNRIAENIPHRTGIQCQARWTEALDPAVRKGRWCPEEDKQLADAITQFGCCWIRVASLIPTRTQRQCRTRWNQIHSQQQQTPSTRRKRSANRRSSSLSISTTTTTTSLPSPPIKYEFVPSLPIPHDPADIPSPSSYFHLHSPKEMEEVLAIYVSSNDHSMKSSLSSTTSRSSSYSSCASSVYSPPALYLPVTNEQSPIHNSSLLQHDLFPMMSSSASLADSNNNKINNNNDRNGLSGNNGFLFHTTTTTTTTTNTNTNTTTEDFDFLLDYNNCNNNHSVSPSTSS